MLNGARLALFVSLFAAGCGGNPYNYARSYSTRGDEERYLRNATEASYEEVRRARPENQPQVAWFAVVEAEPETMPDGRIRARMTLRAHQERHLCSGEGEDTCRVTVSERPVGEFVALVRVSPEDRDGMFRLGRLSLLRIFGRSHGESEGELPVIEVDWYRHWPWQHYVTTASAGRMRR